MITNEELVGIIAERVPAERQNDDVAYGIAYAVGYLDGLGNGVTVGDES